MSSLIKRGNGHDVMPEPSTFTGLVDRLFQNNLNRFFHDDFWGGGLQHQSNVPVNVRETDKDYQLELVAPGLKKEDFHLDISDNMLTVSFEHKEENNKENKDQGWIRKEYRKQ